MSTRRRNKPGACTTAERGWIGIVEIREIEDSWDVGATAMMERRKMKRKKWECNGTQIELVKNEKKPSHLGAHSLLLTCVFQGNQCVHICLGDPPMIGEAWFIFNLLRNHSDTRLLATQTRISDTDRTLNNR